MSGRSLHQRSSHWHRAAQPGDLHRLPVLYLELFLWRAAVQPGTRSGRLLVLICVAAASAQLLNHGLRFLRLTASDSFELQSSARLLSTVLASRFLLRGALLIAGGIALPLFSSGRIGFALAFAAALASEILGRYLFYVSVVPKNMAAPYLASGKEAA